MKIWSAIALFLWLTAHVAAQDVVSVVSDQAKVALSGRIRPAQPRPGLKIETWATHSL